MPDVIDAINIDQIKKLIPHRSPFLLIDRVENVVLDSEAKWSAVMNPILLAISLIFR